jgi:hypothetical protein
MILSYPEQSLSDRLPKYELERVEYVTKEVWLRLIHINNDDIDSMSIEEIHQRIAALKSIEDSPHLSFNWSLKHVPKFKEFVSSIYDNNLNGGADYKIYFLEKYLAEKNIPEHQI